MLRRNKQIPLCLPAPAPAPISAAAFRALDTREKYQFSPSHPLQAIAADGDFAALKKCRDARAIILRPFAVKWKYPRFDGDARPLKLSPLDCAIINNNYQFALILVNCYGANSGRIPADAINSPLLWAARTSLPIYEHICNCYDVSLAVKITHLEIIHGESLNGIRDFIGALTSRSYLCSGTIDELVSTAHRLAPTFVREMEIHLDSPVRFPPQILDNFASAITSANLDVAHEFVRLGFEKKWEVYAYPSDMNVIVLARFARVRNDRLFDIIISQFPPRFDSHLFIFNSLAKASPVIAPGSAGVTAKRIMFKTLEMVIDRRIIDPALAYARALSKSHAYEPLQLRVLRSKILPCDAYSPDQLKLFLVQALQWGNSDLILKYLPQVSCADLDSIVTAYSLVLMRKSVILLFSAHRSDLEVNPNGMSYIYANTSGISTLTSGEIDELINVGYARADLDEHLRDYITLAPRSSQQKYVRNILIRRRFLALAAGQQRLRKYGYPCIPPELLDIIYAWLVIE